MSYATRKDSIDGGATEANYDRWHGEIDEARTIEGKNTGPGLLISELYGTDDSDEVARQISGETSTAGR